MNNLTLAANNYFKVNRKNLKYLIFAQVTLIMYFLFIQELIYLFYEGIYGDDADIYGFGMIPLHVSIISIFAMQAYTVLFIKNIWSAHYKFSKINWFYNFAFITKVLIILLAIAGTTLSILSVDSLYPGMNAFSTSMQNLRGKIISICTIFALIQFRAIPNNLFGFKPYIIASAIVGSIFHLIGFDLNKVIDCAISGIELAFLIKLRNSLPPELTSENMR